MENKNYKMIEYYYKNYGKNEFDNELDYDYKSKYKAELTETDFNIMLEFLERFIGKFELSIVEELED